MKLVPQRVSQGIGRSVLQTKKNSPHIFFVGGLASVVASTVLACKATLQLEAKLDEIKEDLDAVRELKVRAEEGKNNYPLEDHPKDLAYVYFKGAAKIGRLYGPAIILGVAGVGALTGSHIQLARRNAALTAAFAGLSKAFEEYRVRVQEKIGEEEELDLYRGTRDAVVGEGKDKQTIKEAHIPGCSPHARYFAPDTSSEWQNNNEHNRVFIDVQQRYANQLLTSRGHVFLNDIWDALGMERTAEGQLLGWVKNGEGSGYIDLGIYRVQRNVEALYGQEPWIVIDPNVDGIVFNKI